MSWAEAPRPWRRTTTPVAWWRGCRRARYAGWRAQAPRWSSGAPIGFVKVQGGEALLDGRALRLEPIGDAEGFAEAFEGLIEGEAWGVGGEFKEDAAGLVEVDGMEVGTVLDGGDGGVAGDLLAPGELGGVVRGTEGDVMDGAGAGSAKGGKGVDEEVDVVAEGGATGGEAMPVALFGDLLEAHEIEGGGGGSKAAFEEGDAEEAADGVLGGDVREARRVAGDGGGVTDEFELHAVRIGEGEEMLGEAGGEMAGDAFTIEALLPEVERVKGNAEGSVGGFAGTGEAGPGVGPREEGEDGAGGAGVVAEVEVIGAGIVEVDGALDEAKAEDLRVEVEVALGVGGNGGDMMEADDGSWHGISFHGFDSISN